MAENDEGQGQKFRTDPLDYQNLSNSRPSSGGSFFGGFLIGTAVSCGFYLIFIPHAHDPWRSQIAALGLFVLPLAKLVLGIVLATQRPHRRWGVGLLLSMPVVLLIVVGYICGPLFTR